MIFGVALPARAQLRLEAAPSGTPAAGVTGAAGRGEVELLLKVEELPIDLELDGVPIDVKYADVVNARDIGSISVQRAFLVQKITKLRFDDGALLAAIIRKPSEVEEVTLLPLNVVNAVLSTPSGLWQAAFTDQQFKQATLKQLAQQQADITQLQQSNRALMMQGASPIDDFSKEKYDLNCRDPVSTTGLINLLQ